MDLDKARETESSGGGRLQLIDSEQQFTGRLAEYMQDRWRVSRAGFEYDVVAVFGSQSTGKSTLLNRLFGTQFDVMSEAARQQTTRGIWADRAVGMQSVVVLDVEGTDGRERGEQQDFERKSALFSLAVASVVVVNMWENMVGLYNGANMGLLKTVLEVHVQLFGSKEEHCKTLLFFVIRDHVSAAPLASLAATLAADVDRIWAGVAKPAALASAELGDFFDLRFASLPHKQLQAERFEREAAALRRQFAERGGDGGGGGGGAAYKRRVPADGFARYAAAVWEQVASNRDLDLPTQQELLAQFRCDEIAAAALEPFRAALGALRPRVQEGGVVDALGADALAARAAALAGFDAQAARYHGGVYARKRAALAQAVDGDVRALFELQVKNALALCGDAFARDAARALADAGGDAGGDYAFAGVVARVRAAAEVRFARVADALAAPPDAAWDFAAEARQLHAALDGATDRLRAAEADRAVDAEARRARDALADAVAQHLGGDAPDVWRGVEDAFDAACEGGAARLRRRLGAAGVARDALDAAARRLHAALWDGVAHAARDEAADAAVLARLRGVVDARFRYDAAGLPRVWRPADDIDALFAGARDAALALLPRLSRIALTRDAHARQAGFFPADYDLERSLALITPARQRDLSRRFARDADALFVEAKRAMVATHGRVPPWVLALLVLLGWNEAMAVLFNPLYLLLVALVAGAAFVVHSLGLWRPLLRAANRLAATAGDHVHGLLVEAVNRTEPPPASSARHRSRPKSAAATAADDGIELEPLGSDDVGSASSASSASSSPPL
ncbi:Dynamin-like GTPase that mediates homotypic ER fusion [Coemansia sp. RSA 2320]|nr:Dynamin-like GTPase that mediates homotypic ER fusion [Coemansia sp. RSA 2320]